MVHLVYCDNAGKRGERELEKILCGAKTMVVRGAAGRKIPHSRVYPGETLYFIEKGSGQITARAVVETVENHVKLTDEQIEATLARCQPRLALTGKQKIRWHKKCLCLVAFRQAEAIAPLEFDHQGNMDDWLILEKIEDVVAGTSIPYNYEKSRF